MWPPHCQAGFCQLLSGASVMVTQSCSPMTVLDFQACFSLLSIFTYTVLPEVSVPVAEREEVLL